jgi:hypothetical protein
MRGREQGQSFHLIISLIIGSPIIAIFEENGSSGQCLQLSILWYCGM